jgi:glycine/sarcosine N-methyltransferase
MTKQFYDDMADQYHLIFEDWDAAMRKQGEVIAKLLPRPDEAGTVLDVACGIGTQALALAAVGYSVEGCDLSSAAVARARRESLSRYLNCTFRVDDMRTLETAKTSAYGVIMAMDNALPHLDSDEDIVTALTAMRERLWSGGKMFVSIRDYARLLQERPRSLPPAFYGDERRRRIVFQVWDWIDERRYTLHLYLTHNTDKGWIAHHFVGRYRSVTPEEIAGLSRETGFRNVRILSPADSGFYQPIIAAEAP